MSTGNVVGLLAAWAASGPPLKLNYTSSGSWRSLSLYSSFVVTTLRPAPRIITTGLGTAFVHMSRIPMYWTASSSSSGKGADIKTAASLRDTLATSSDILSQFNTCISSRVSSGSAQSLRYSSTVSGRGFARPLRISTGPKKSIRSYLSRVLISSAHMSS